MREIAEEAEALRVEGGSQAFEEQATEQAGERLDGEKEVRPPGDPARPIERETAAWHDAMHVWMMRQRLPPCVQNSDDADLCAEPTRVGGERRHRFDRRREQDRVDDGLVLERDGGDRRGQCEHDVEIRNRQKFGLACGKPLRPRHALTLRAMAVAAGIVGDARHAAVVARLDVTTERGCATRNDRAHHAPFDAAQMSGVGQTIGVAMPTQNVSDLEANARPAPCHGRLTGRSDFQAQTIERALGRADRMGRDLRVARRRRQIVVAEQNLDDPDVGSVLQQMRREAVAQRMQSNALRQPRRLDRRPAGCVQHGWINRMSVIAAWEQKRPWPAASRQYVRRMPRSCGDSITLRSFAPLP